MFVAQKLNPLMSAPRRLWSPAALVIYGTLAQCAMGVTTYYVGKVNCNDNNSGTDPQNPLCSIHVGANRAVSGDTVTVGPGTYEVDGNETVYILGKDITVKSADGADATIIKAIANATAVYFGVGYDEEENAVGIGRAALLEGFTVTLDEDEELGGGIVCQGTSDVLVSPTIRKNIIRENRRSPITGRGGGGIELYNSAALLTDNTICNNSSSRVGGGLFAGGVLEDDMSQWVLTIDNCRLEGNTSLSAGGGIHVSNGARGNLIISRCAIYENFSFALGGGISLSPPVVAQGGRFSP